MSTSSRTATFSPIMAWQICSHLEVAPPAFWMSSVRPAALNALSRDGRSLFSHRLEVTVSGRMTPTLPAAAAASRGRGRRRGCAGGRDAAPVGRCSAGGRRRCSAGGLGRRSARGRRRCSGGRRRGRAALLPLLLPQPVSATAAMALNCRELHGPVGHEMCLLDRWRRRLARRRAPVCCPRQHKRPGARRERATRQRLDHGYVP